MSTVSELRDALTSLVDWANGVDLHGVPAQDIAKRWNAMKGMYGRKEIFLLARPNARYMAWHTAMDEATMSYLVVMLDPEQLQIVVDILTYYNPIGDLHYAREYNTL